MAVSAAALANVFASTIRSDPGCPGADADAALRAAVADSVGQTKDSTGFKGVEGLARALIEKCGSLERAYASFDYNNKKKVTRTQWETGMLVLHMDCEELTGVTLKQLFKMMDTMNGPGTGTGAVTLENWTKFFSQLKDTDAADLLQRDLGKYGGRMKLRPTRATHEFGGDHVCVGARRGCSPEGVGMRRGGALSPDSSLANARTHLGEASVSSNHSSAIYGGETQLYGGLEGAQASCDHDRRAETYGLCSSGHSSPCLGSGGGFSGSSRRARCFRRRASSSSTGAYGEDSGRAGFDVSFVAGEPTWQRRSPGGTAIAAAAAGVLYSPMGSGSISPAAAKSRLGGHAGEENVDGASCALAGNLSSRGCRLRSGLEAPDAPAAPGSEHIPIFSPRSRRQNSTGAGTGLGKNGFGEPVAADGGRPAPLEAVLLSARSHYSDDVTSDASSCFGDLMDRLSPMNATSDALQLALAGKGSIDGLADEEIAAVAEQQQLEEELHVLDLAGIEALAYVFAAKCGSIKRAFRYFDSARKRQFPQVVWNTGVCLMRIDMERLTGFKAYSIFSMIDSDPRDGLISKTEWMNFFKAALDGNLGELLRRAAGTDGSELADRAAGKQVALRRAKSASRGSSKSSRPSTKEKRPCSKEDSLGGGSSSTRGWSKGMQDQSSVGVCGADGAHSCDHPRPKRKRPRGGVAFAAAHEDDVGLGPTADMTSGEVMDLHAAEVSASEVLDFRAHVRAELGALLPDAYLEYPEGMPSWQVAIVHEVAEELELWSASVWGIFVGNCKEFADVTYESLQEIELGDSLEFPPLSQVQTKVLHLLAAELELYAHTDAEDCVVIFNLGDFVHEVRQALTNLELGGSHAFAAGLTSAQRHLVHAIAAELGLWIHEDVNDPSAAPVEVFNLAAFAEQARAEIAPLESGEHKTFPADLTATQRRVVHLIATDLDLEAHSHDEGEGGCVVTVGHLRLFKDEVKTILETLKQGESHIFDSELTLLQRKVVHTLAAELRLESSSDGEGSARSVTVTRPHERALMQDGQTEDSAIGVAYARRNSASPPTSAHGDAQSTSGVGRKDHATAPPMAASASNAKAGRGGGGDDLRPPEQSTETMLSKLFDIYATGSHRGEKIFLRFPDLKKFAEDARGLTPSLHRTFCKFEGVLELTFDDTIQLQSDMGIHTTKGLTLPWFTVFIQKALTRLGMQVVSLLMSLLSDRSGKTPDRPLKA